MNVFVTGGSGYIGSVVVRRLLERCDQVTVFDNLERGHRANLEVEIEGGGGQRKLICPLVVGDLRNENDILLAMREAKPDAVIHFAAYALVGESMRDPQMYFDNNIRGGANLLKAMADVGCNRIVFSSSCATYGVPDALPIEESMPQRPTNPYGYSKLVFEQMATWLQAQCGLKPTFLRYFNAAGAIPALGLGEDHEPETHIIPNVLKVALGQKEFVEVFGTDYPTPDGTCVRDYVHLEDLCSAHLLALDQGAVGAFNLGTGKGVSVLEIVEACRNVTGRPIPVRLSPRRPGDPPALYASGAKARRELGWNPTHSDVETVVRDAWMFHLAHPEGLCRKMV